MPRGKDTGFVVADSRNLPKVTFPMIADYMSSPEWCQPELRNVKTARSGREDYVNEAVGFVQLQEKKNYTHIKASVCPETKLRGQKYTVNCRVDDQRIIEASCENCPASQGGCKHTVAMLFWLLRKTMEPSPTSVESYWVAPRLGKVLDDDNILPATQIQPALTPKILVDKPKLFFDMSINFVKDLGKRHDILLQKQFDPPINLSIHSLGLRFEKTPGPKGGNAFIGFCSEVMTDKACQVIANETKAQSESSLWYELRYARLTASKLYEASRCSVYDGSLVSTILGATKIRDTDAMKKGRLLEPQVLKLLGEQLSAKVLQVGLILRKDLPIFGASPDGIIGDYVVEVKCPTTDQCYKKYFSTEKDDSKVPIANTKPAKKYYAQMLLQMLTCGKKKGLFCVADPKFEKNKAFSILEVLYDEEFLRFVMRNATAFWLRCIFPKVIRE